MGYPQRVSRNILPLSVAGTLPEAFEEWSFTEETVDHEQPIENCELCEQEQLRYHFEIRNSITKNTLWVGSQCILQFGVSVFEDGRKLPPNLAKKKLGRLVQKMRMESCIKALERLDAKENNDILRKALEHYRRNKSLTPKFAFVVFWRLQRNNIDHSSSFFKISLRRDRHKTDLKEMPLSRVHLLWPAMSPSQRKMAISMGHTPPAKSVEDA